MPDHKEKSKVGKTKGRPTIAAPPRQAARLMKDSYLRQLDQRPEQTDAGSGEPAQQVEDAGHWAVDELTGHPRSKRQKERHIKERPRNAEKPTGESAPKQQSNAPKERPEPEPRERQTDAPKERQAAQRPRNGGKEPVDSPNAPKERRTAVPSAQGGEPSTHTAIPKERQAAAIRERRTAIKERAAANQEPRTIPKAGPSATQPSAQTGRANQPPASHALNNGRRGPAALHQPPTATSPRSAQGAVAQAPKRLTAPIGQRGASAPKVRTTALVGGKAPPGPKMRGVLFKPAPRTAGQRSQRQAARQMVTQAKKAAKTAAVAVKRVTVAVVKAAAALVGAIVGIAGGGILLIALVIVIVIAAVANSPFGLFFAAEKNAPDTVSVSEAVNTVNIAYNAKLEVLQNGSYDSIVIEGQAAEWPDVLAAFAARTAGAEDGADVATLDPGRVDKLKAVFWDMTAITTRVETISHEDGSSETILHIIITSKTADDMRTQYAFTNYQNTALDELLADRVSLSKLAGSLTITNADVQAVLDALPEDLTPERREAVRTALTLVGKVSYFWGGKSSAIGWDNRWGTLQKVTAAGNSTTGTFRPFGLDCSGFMDWVFNNSAGIIVGHGGGASSQHTYCTDISASEAQPGDLAFFPDDSHVGIVVGRSDSGGLLVCHCSYSQNNVVVTDYTATGFTALGRPEVFD